MSDEPVLLLDNDAAPRDSTPALGSDAALGGAFNSQGRSNDEFPFGTVVTHKGHLAQVVRPARKPGCYCLLYYERQVEITHVHANTRLERHVRACYIKAGTTERQECIVEKIDHSFKPAIVYIRILVRNAKANELIKQ